MNVINVQNVTKSFRKGFFDQRIILNNINLNVNQGDFFVLKGENGAGKSTLIKLILGLEDTQQGSIKLFSKDPKDPASKIYIGTIFQEVNPPDCLTVEELVNLIGSYYPNPVSTEEILQTCGLSNHSDSFPNKLAGGEKQRLYFALALVGNPKLLILDEPTKNLDFEGQQQCWEKIEYYHKLGITILMVTHIQSDQDRLQSLATHIIELVDGKLIYNKQAIKMNSSVNNTNQFNSLESANWLIVLINQTWIEILQLLRTPVYLMGVLLFSCLVALLPAFNDLELTNRAITIFSVISLLIFSIDRLGKRVALERVEGWLKLLKVTPLPPRIYIAAKIVMTMLILIISLLTIFTIGTFKFGLENTIFEWIILSIKLLIITIPFALIGIALGYILSPKNIDPIAGLLIPFGILTSGIIDFPYKNLLILSPFYHLTEIMKILLGIESIDGLLIHLLWLGFYGVLAVVITKFLYQRDIISQ